VNSSLWRSPSPRDATDACIAVHSEAAVRRGASKEEMAEALGVAVAVNAGAALVYSTRVMDAIKEYPHEVNTIKPSATSSATNNASHETSGKTNMVGAAGKKFESMNGRVLLARIRPVLRSSRLCTRSCTHSWSGRSGCIFSNE
jgi:hypothetical protein